MAHLNSSVTQGERALLQSQSISGVDGEYSFPEYRLPQVIQGQSPSLDPFGSLSGVLGRSGSVAIRLFTSTRRPDS